MINIFKKSVEETYKVPRHEAAYRFEDEIGERAMRRTVNLDLNKNPFKSLSETFSFFDVDNSGHISKQEFAEAITRLDEKTISKNITTEVELDGNDMISFSAFSRFISHIRLDNYREKSHGAMPNQPHWTGKEKNWGNEGKIIRKEKVREPTQEEAKSSKWPKIQRLGGEKNIKEKIKEQKKLLENWPRDHDAHEKDESKYIIAMSAVKENSYIGFNSEEEPVSPESMPSKIRSWYKPKEWETSNEGEVSNGTTYDVLKYRTKVIPLTSPRGEQTHKSPFMTEDSDFRISNHVLSLAGVDSAREPRRVKNWEMKLLVEFQEKLLAEMFKLPKAMLKIVYCCFLFWVFGMIVIMFIYGVNMDRDAEVVPDVNIVAAGSSLCPAREVVSFGYTVNVDVSAKDAINFKGAQRIAEAVNSNFTRYGNDFLEGWKVLEFNFMPSNVPESCRFLVSSVTSWMVGTVFLPLFDYIFIAFVQACFSRNKRERWRSLIDQEEEFRNADIADYNPVDQSFFICFWPSALIKVLAEDSKMEGKCKLKISDDSVCDKIIQYFPKSMLCD